MTPVLTADPQLGVSLTGAALTAATEAALAPVVAVEVGEAAFRIQEPETHGHLGLLVLAGVIARHVSFGSIGAVEFLGPRDLVRPWSKRDDPGEPAQVRWEVLAPAQLAVLDGGFAHRIRAWPQIHAALLDRAAQRSDSQALQAALGQAGRVEDRVLLALWHFAGRWGEADQEGRRVKLTNITGEVLARFVGARRQSVSTALGKLADGGQITRMPDRSIVLPSQPPELEAIQPGQRASDRAPRLRYNR